MKLNRFSISTLIYICSCFTMAYAEDSNNIINLSPYVVTASRIKMQKTDVAQSVDIIEDDEIALTQSVFATDLLKKTTSVDVIQYPGGSSGVSIRGFRPEYSNETNPRTLLLIDGRPVSVSVGSIPTENIARIEVLKGPASSVYGPSAMGGVLNIITKKSTDELHGSFFAGIGSFDMVVSGFQLGGSLTESFNFDVSMDWIDRGEDYKFGESKSYMDFDKKKPALDEGKSYRDVYDNTAYETINAALRLGYIVNQNWQCDLRYDLSDQRNTGVPGPLSKQFYEISNFSKRDLRRQGVSMDWQGYLEHHNVSSKLYYNLLESFSLYDLDSYSKSYRGRSYDKEITEWGIQLQDTWSLSDYNQLLVGFDLAEQEETNIAKNGNGSVRTYFCPDYSRERYGLFAESLNSFLDESLLFNLGVRYDSIDTSVEASSYEGTSYVYSGGSQEFDQINPRAGFVWKFNENLRFHSSIGTAFIAPDSREIAGYYESIYSSYVKVSYGNENLDPETSVTYDAGLEFANEFVTFDATIFHTNVDDRIVSKNTGKTEPSGDDGKKRKVYTYVNCDAQQMRGLELSGKLSLNALFDRLNNPLTLSTDITWMDEAQVEFKNGTTEPVRNIAEWKANVALTYTKSAFTTLIAARYNGTRWDKDYRNNSATSGKWVEFSGFWVFDWSCSYQINSNHKFTLSLNNLMDKFYYEKMDYPLEGRNAMLRYTYSF